MIAFIAPAVQGITNAENFNVFAAALWAFHKKSSFSLVCHSHFGLISSKIQESPDRIKIQSISSQYKPGDQS